MNKPATSASVEQAAMFAAAQRGDPAAARPLPGYTVADLWNGFTPIAELVKRMLGPQQVTVLFGPSGVFKSVLSLDLGMCVGSQQQQFHGIRTRHAGVLYVAGEGHAGMKKRARAWLLAHGYTAASEQPAIYFTEAGADLIGNPAQLRLTAEYAAQVIGKPIGLVILDTLASNYGSGDENLARDMALAIAGARYAEPNAAVLLVHHTGHSNGGGEARERGSYALIAAADYRLCVAYDDAAQRIEVKWLKCKDDERPEPLTFTWKRVPLEWEDADGEELTSVILARAERETEDGQRTSLGKNQRTALRVLQRLHGQRIKYLEEQGEPDSDPGVILSAWRSECQKVDIERNRFAEVVKALQEKAAISLNGELARPLKAHV